MIQEKVYTLIDHINKSMALVGSENTVSVVCKQDETDNSFLYRFLYKYKDVINDQDLIIINRLLTIPKQVSPYDMIEIMDAFNTAFYINILQETKYEKPTTSWELGMN